MKWLLICIFAVSSLSLLVVLLKSQLFRISFKKVIGHWILAGVLLFALNFFEFTQPYALPINLLTVSVTAVLGIPGIALLGGVQYILL